MGDVIGIVMILLAIWAVCDFAYGALTPRRTLMAGQRRKHFRRRITMRPGFRYLDPDGTVCMSPTGREKDCICGKRHVTGPTGEALERPDDQE